MLEKRWYAVSPQLISADGSALGFILISDACGLLKVKQLVNMTDTLGNFRTFEVKRVDDPDKVYLGPVGKPLTCYDDLSIYTVANGAFLFADEQQRSKVPEQEIERATYEEEPVVARRSVLVDECGVKISKLNPLPVDAVLNIGAINVDLDAKTGDNVAISAHPAPIFTEAADTLDAPGYKQIFSYTSSNSGTRVSLVVVAVSTTSNIQLKINGAVKREYRTSPSDRQASFLFSEHRPLPAGSILTVEVEAERFIRPQYLTFTSLEGYIA